MSGVYFIVRPHLQECCIGYSGEVNKDVQLITKGLYDQNHEVHIVSTYDIVAAEAVHIEVINYINANYESCYISDDWYNISSVEIGSIRDKANAYHRRFHFVKIEGEICKFIPYDEYDNSPPAKKRKN